MKNTLNKLYRIFFALVTVLLLSGQISYAQEEAEERPPDRPVRNLFESNFLIDHQTAIVPYKGTLEFDIQHRFGTWDKGYDDFWGIYAPSNIRVGLTYVFIENLQLGAGMTKERNTFDFNLKYAILKQTRSGRVPLSMAYYANMAIDSRDERFFTEKTDRYTYFHQLMIARKFTDKLSLQVAANLSHFNGINGYFDDQNEVVFPKENNHFSASFLGRYKLTDVSAFILNYDLPITDHVEDPNANLAFGLEFVTSSHAFQLFVGNFKGIIPQYNHFLNTNSFGDNEILIGFNMTRLWNF